jgi:hypothetical protein
MLGTSRLFDDVATTRYQYLNVVSVNIEDVPKGKQIEDFLVPPKKTPKPPEFALIDWNYVPDWDGRANEGTMIYAGKLYLPVAIVPDDRDYIYAAFKDQSWKRWVNASLPIAGFALGPPLLLLLLGAAGLWVMRGFRV